MRVLSFGQELDIKTLKYEFLFAVGSSALEPFASKLGQRRPAPSSSATDRDQGR